MRRCERCGTDEKVEEHHYHPRFANNIRGEGEKKLLCKNKCHLPLHVRLSGVLWKYIEPHNRLLAINEIKSFTDEWINDGKEKQTLSYIQLRINNFLDYERGIKHCSNCDAELDIEDNYCEYCCAAQSNQTV